MSMYNVRESQQFNRHSHLTNRGSEFVRYQQERKSHGELVGNDNIEAMVHRATDESVREIENVITDLLVIRKKLQTEASRVQYEIFQYANFNKTAFRSSKVICESLRNRFRGEQNDVVTEKRTARRKKRAAERAAKAARKMATISQLTQTDSSQNNSQVGQANRSGHVSEALIPSVQYDERPPSLHLTVMPHVRIIDGHQ